MKPSCLPPLPLSALPLPPLLLLLLPLLFSCSSPNGKKIAAGHPDSTSGSATASTATASTATASTGTASIGADSTLPFRGVTSAEQDSIEIQASSFLDTNDNAVTIPPYGLEKVKQLIKKIHSEDDLNTDDTRLALTDSAWSGLSLPEKFTYSMIHAENYSQMCDPLPERSDEAHRIYGETPDYFGEWEWSDRQVNFFKEHRDSVEQLIRSAVQPNGRVGLNFLDIIVTIDGKEMIPWLIDACHRDSTNHYILTAMLLLMKNDKYPEFIQSTSYKKLYGDMGNEYSAWLVYNKANEDLIIRRATNFYHAPAQ